MLCVCVCTMYICRIKTGSKYQIQPMHTIPTNWINFITNFQEIKPYSPCKRVSVCGFLLLSSNLNSSCDYIENFQRTHNELKAYISKPEASNPEKKRENHVKIYRAKMQLVEIKILERIAKKIHWNSIKLERKKLAKKTASSKNSMQSNLILFFLLFNEFACTFCN